jgi:peptidoglycan DL-endopeptidase CwlO
VTTRIRGRHRAALPPKTPLTDLAAAVRQRSSVVGRRSAVVAASSGLVLTLGLPAAEALPVGSGLQSPAGGITTAAGLLTTPAPAAQAPAVTASAPADAEPAAFRSAVASVSEPPPPPAPAAEPAAARGERASRSGDRGSVQAASTQATASATSSGVLGVAAGLVGIGYRYGGTTPAGFDCSGFTSYVWRQMGVSLPRTAAQQAAAGTRVSRSAARPGDLVVFGSGAGVYHIGLYAGGNQMYDSPRAGKSVSKRAIWTSAVTFVRVA